MDETELDRKNQNEVADYIYKRIVGRFPFVGHKIELKPKRQSGDEQDHDFDVLYSGLYVGVIEVKCRTRDATFLLMKHGFLFTQM